MAQKIIGYCIKMARNSKTSRKATYLHKFVSRVTARDSLEEGFHKASLSKGRNFPCWKKDPSSNSFSEKYNFSWIDDDGQRQTQDWVIVPIYASTEKMTINI